MTKDEVFYVGVKNPDDLRRDVLESTRDTIAILKTYENFKKIRSEKASQTAHLKILIKELDVLVGKLKKELPQTRLREKVTEKPSPKKQAQKKKEKLSEIEKLEMELAEIESKLSSI